MMGLPLLMTHGATAALGAELVALRWVDGVCLAAAGDASVTALSPKGETLWRREDVHAGALLCAAPFGDGFATGGDDGRVMRISASGEPEILAEHKGAWIEAIAAQPKMVAAAMGKDVALIKPGEGIIHRFDHPSAVNDVAFEPNGRRLAAAHYNGVTISWASNPDSRRKTLPWKGAHLKVLWSPDARFIVTAMQENALHGWRLQDVKDFQMAGYPAKIRSLAFSPDGAWLVCAGALELTGWPFVGQNGPMGRNAALLGEMGEAIAMVSPCPTRPLIAVGDAKGELALFSSAEEMRPALVSVPEGAAITAAAWSPDGCAFAFGDEEGRVGLLDFTAFMQ